MKHQTRWRVTQPLPGIVVWTSPTGHVYVRRPDDDTDPPEDTQREPVPLDPKPPAAESEREPPESEPPEPEPEPPF